MTNEEIFSWSNVSFYDQKGSHSKSPCFGMPHTGQPLDSGKAAKKWQVMSGGGCVAIGYEKTSVQLELDFGWTVFATRWH